MLRTHNCGELKKTNLNETVRLSGWVDSWRDHGGVIFIDLRDRWGKTQLVFNPDSEAELHKQAAKLRSEYVIAVTGIVCERPAGTINTKLATGQIEVMVHAMDILNESETPPFEIFAASAVSEDLRLKYRFLDLRNQTMFSNLSLRYKITKVVRDYLDTLDFIEIETPYLTRSTPEGARDFLVPARLSPGHFYALPQSPQLFKQILMVSNFDRYFQIVRCFRDEDLRADRQPEHTQIDIEMSFIEEEDIYEVIENMISRVFKQVLNRDLAVPFPRISYQDAMNTYGSDKPDLRFDMKIQDASDIFRGQEFKIFQQILENGGVIKGIKAPGCGGYSRKDLDDLTAFVQQYGAKGLAWFKIGNDSIDSPIAKFFTKECLDTMCTLFEAEKGDLILFVASDWRASCSALGALRLHLGKKLSCVDTGRFEVCWVVEFPLWEYNKEEKRLDAMHHPFTAPQPEDISLMDTQPEKVRSRAYDLVLNGTEIGGGSIRIHQEHVQEKIFELLNISKDEAEEKFGFLLRALKFGAPPHGGIALGLDRLTAMLLGLDSIRDVIAFPKTQKGICPLTDAPGTVDPKQLRELSISTKR